MYDRDSHEAGGERLFVDRKDESQALAESLRQHSTRMRNGEITGEILTHVLTFYGDGGVGKSELSTRLGRWMQGQLPVDDAWGPAPDQRVACVVSWDAYQSHGGLDPTSLLAQLRIQLGTVKRTWPAFDLALTALWGATRPGQPLVLEAPTRMSESLGDVVAGLLGDGASAALAVADLAGGGGVGSGAYHGARHLISRIRASAATRRLLSEYPRLESTIVACDRLSGNPTDAARAAGQVAFLLTQEIDRMQPHERPLIVVLVDHMERLQIAGDAHTGEITLNRLVARLPYCLFVVTGRNSLRWHDPRATHLDAFGPRTWPLLTTEERVSREPHQHAIGNLSPTDAATLLQTGFARGGVVVESSVVDELVRATNGWPLHLDTIVAVAEQRRGDDGRLTLADLSGPLPKLVERLLDDLPQDEKDAFRAACLLPYFDEELVAAAAQVAVGAVKRLVARSIVRPHDGTYPFRIHDTLRALVREAGAEAAGGWAPADWKRHAELALAEADARYSRALATEDDLRAVQSLALGINVAVENDVLQTWLHEALKTAPSVRQLGPLVPEVAPTGCSPDVADMVEFVQLREVLREGDKSAELRAMSERGGVFGAQAGLWCAYELRKTGRIDEALAQLDDVIVRFGDRVTFYENQKLTTLRLGRRFQDAVALAETYGRPNPSQDAALQRAHGQYSGMGGFSRERAATIKSRRYQLELLGNWTLHQQRDTGISLEAAREVYEDARLVNHDAAQSEALVAMVQERLFDEAYFWQAEPEVAEMSERRFQPYASWALMHAMRAWAVGDGTCATRAREIAERAGHRGMAWIPVEILLEELGMPLAPCRRSGWSRTAPSVADGSRSSRR